jgi:serine/threonine-protein kinase
MIDRYEVLQRLGEGATATVYRGRQPTIGREIAIKVLHPHLSVVRKYRDRFQREARAVGRLNHANIVSILDFSGPNAEDCYIVTELVDGVTLLTLLETAGPLPSEVAACIAADLCSALAYAHREGVIHRDLKPENVMIRRDGRVKLMDFGVARVLDEASLTMDGALLGSPAYMSPEQASDGPLDGRTDLFSLGSVLFHAVTGQIPFHGSSPPVILRNVIEGQRADVQELAPDVSPTLASVIDRLMQPRPEDRYADADAAREALQAVPAEVGLGPDDPALALHAWLRDAHAARSALDAHVRAELLARGKALLASGDTFGALRLLNRLLAMDNENAEVFTLVQGLHRDAPAPSRPWRWVGAAVVALALAAGAVMWTLRAPDPPVTGVSTRDTDVHPPVTTGTGDPSPPAPVPPQRAPETSPPGTKPPGTAPAATESPRRSAREGAETRAPAPGRADAYLVLRVAAPVEIWVDGTRRGAFRIGPSDQWVATRARPLVLPAGERLISLRSSGGVAEAWEQKVALAPGETRELDVELRRKAVTLQIDPTLPSECRVRVGTTEYGTVREFGASLSLREPDPATRIRFACPPPLGDFGESVGPTFGGEFIVVPRTLPATGTGTPP